MGYEDQCLHCKKCGSPFSWSAGEQEFYASRDLHPPKFCPACREARKERARGKIWGNRVAMTDTETRRVLCSRCQAPASLKLSTNLGRAICPRCTGTDADTELSDILTIEAWIGFSGKIVEAPGA